MSVLDPPDSADLPGAIREFHRARRAWLQVWCDPGKMETEVWQRYASASDRLKAELRSRGGSWTHDRFRYRLDKRDGIEIEQTAAAIGDDEGAGGQSPADARGAKAGAVAPA